MSEDAIALEGYERLAEAYAARIDTKAHNAYYERPATLSLLPPVKGKRVLDAGCGPGVYAEWLVNHGAEVVGFDASPKMVELANQRLQGKARILRASLERSFDFLEAASFDLVISPLALDYVEDWGLVFREFFRLLREPGHLVFSVGHPFDEFSRRCEQSNYFEVERVEATFNWPDYGVVVTVPYYRRSLEATLQSLLGAGFILDRLVEPRPTPEFRDQDPADYEKLLRQPGFLCIRARKGTVPADHSAA